MTTETPASGLAAFNRSTWTVGGLVGHYANRQLRPIEVLIMVWFREQYSGRVLELGCGAGRITGYLVQVAEEVRALDISPEMVAECRRRYPAADVEVGDVGDLSGFPDSSLDAVVAGCNILDVFDDGERRRVLHDIRRILVPGGLLVMSSHNRAYRPRVRGPWHVRTAGLRAGNPYGALQFAADVIRVPRRVVRHRSRRHLEVDTPDYAIVSDGAHEFSLVHYFTSSEAQRRQFAGVGLEFVLSADLDGRTIDIGYQAPDCPEIHYVARRPGSP
jgi:SAM-dependent methyltransferase